MWLVLWFMLHLISYLELICFLWNVGRDFDPRKVESPPLPTVTYVWVPTYVKMPSVNIKRQLSWIKHPLSWCVIHLGATHHVLRKNVREASQRWIQATKRRPSWVSLLQISSQNAAPPFKRLGQICFCLSPQTTRTTFWRKLKCPNFAPQKPLTWTEVKWTRSWLFSVVLVREVYRPNM